MLYLGATIHADGKFGCEISRKIGAASAAFKCLCEVWKNTSVTMRRKLHIFNMVVVSKLKYGVASAWLSRADLRRLDGFHAKCLRKMLKIPAAYISRISNDSVRNKAGVQPLSASVAKAQLALMEAVLNQPEKMALRRVAFQGTTTRPMTDAYVRKVGRPRHNWCEQVMKMRHVSGAQ